MKSPFPYFGGKSKIATAIWQRFGNVPNYVEPFAGSLAVLLNRPHEPKTETVNDIDCYIANFWRALRCDPEGLAEWADWPVNEADLHSRHLWLLQRSEFRQLMKTDPDYFDVKIAGWWVWGICQWIGSGWCAEKYYDENSEAAWKARPHLGNTGMGIHRPSQQLPHLGDAGMGIFRPKQQRPELFAGKGILRKDSDLLSYFHALAARLRRVRVCCGDWSRVLGDSVTHKHGLTAIFLDPPYSHDVRDDSLYGQDHDVAPDVRQWAVANGDNPLLRIALCGYDNEHTVPDNWTLYRWKAAGGYGSQGEGAGRENANRECVWFSPHCIDLRKPRQATLLEVGHD